MPFVHYSGTEPRVVDQMELAVSLSIASNIDSLKAQGNLRRTSNVLSSTFERLSSGLRINSAKDDPAGLALADGLRRDAAVASVAMRNASDGISVTAVTDSALGEVSTILTRMSELATQSANGVYTNTQRSALSSEFLALGSEIERIARTTTFNSLQLLSNSSNITVQVGLDATANSQISIEAVTGTLSGIGIGTVGGALSYSIIDISTAGSTYAASLAITAISSAITAVSTSRGRVGAAESRLNTALNYITIARENFVAAESRIRDADVAQEVAEMVRLQVLQQAGTAVLAQANQQPATVLRLLQ